MEAYAAVTSLLNLLEHVQFYHARRPYFLDEQQSQLTYLGKQVSSLQSYLEAYHNGDGQDAQCLEIRIADKSYEAEDIIESHIVGDKFLENNEFIGSVNNFSQRLEKLVAEMDCIAKEAMGIKEKSTLKDQKHRFSSPVVSSSRAPLGIDSMVGFHDEMKCIIDKLIRQTVRKIISITGMGGIGKTTLAKNVYDNPAVVQRFDVRCWVTISQGYDVREMLLCIVRDMKASDEGDRLLKCHEIGLKVHKYLSQRRYLIVLDDVWSIEAWEEIQLYLPDDNNGSRILVTSRLLGVANNFDASNHFEMKFLGENESWNLLCKKVFIQESCPPELEEIGKRIARYCKGLPLTIVVIGGLLAKSKMILRHWKDILEDTSKIAMSGDDDNCSRILSLSYNHLPIYLKPCFIYMGVFPEDHSIRVSKIIKLWVAEGFLKSIYGKSLEEVAHDCLKDLIDRNLIFVDKFGLTGKMKVCKIHDLLRDLCLREARKCRFFCLLKEQSKDISQELSYMRRVAFNGRQKNSLHELGHALQSASSLRTYLDHFCEYIHGGAMLTLCYFKLLRVLDDEDDMYDLQDIIQFVNARYVNTWSLFNTKSLSAGDIVHHRNFFWNVQTLILNYSAWNWEGLFVIWEMPQLRHLTIAKFCLPDPPSRVDGQDIVVLENLQTLAVVRNFRSTEEILERVPNIKILKIIIGGGNNDDDAKLSLQSLGNLCRLRKLQSLNCQFSTSSCIDLSDIFRHNVKFPLSLKKVNLQWCLIEWDDMGALIGGGIPQLEHLKLYGCCTGSEQWNPVEGQFDSLKVLEILRTGPVQWNADCVHFPCLEHLVLSCVDELKEIPPGIGEIETLRSICVVKGDTSLVDSAKEILEEQRKLGNEDFTLQIINMFPEDRTIKYKSDLAITNKKKRNVDGPTQYDSSSVDSFFRNYKLGKTLGIGSFGKVKIAEHILTGHKVTVKILNRRRIKNRDMEEQVRKEIKILRLLMHPHIEHLYEVVETQSDIYIVMEYAKYGELFDYIVEKGRLHDEEARTFFQQIISAVEYCHMNMVVHRDLKPENLLLDSKCNVKISDFGLSNMMRDGHFLKTICGSPNYAAPEVIKGKLYAGPEVDVWSCGVVLYALLCGYLPFDDENMPNLFKKIKGGIYTIPSHLSAGARDLISRMLVVDPMKRTCIPEIRSHPWFQANLPNYLAVPPLDTTQQAKTIDEDILQEVIKMGFERNALVDSLRNRVQNEGTITYYLLLDNRF